MTARYMISLLILLTSPISYAVPTLGHKMMVATPTTLSAEVAQETMKKGGNAVDVAVSIALTLAVTNPRHASLGGGGFAMVKMGKDPVKALDFREVAPAKADKDYFSKKSEKASQDGAHAVAVPGIPAGLWALHKKYGKIHWSQLFDTPIALARKGHHLSGENAQAVVDVKSKFNGAGKKYFLTKNGETYKPGELFKQNQLAKALNEMRNRGVVPFYEGTIAQDIAATIKNEGGVLTRDDLKNYKVRWLDPIVTNYRNHTLYLMPPPSSGGLLISASLKMLEMLKTDRLPPMSTLEYHYFAEVMKVNFRNRNFLGDPDFIKNPTDEFLDPAKLQKWADQIKPDSILKIDPINTASYKESDQTTHFSVLDSNGNAVAMTITLNGSFGSKVVSEKYGIALNNEMDDFTTKPGSSNQFDLQQGNGNLVEPGKRPLSSMSPTLVEKNGKIVIAVGAPGGPRIITGVLQTLYRLLVSNYNMEEAIYAPRVHHQYRPDIVYIDYRRLPPLSIEALETMGYRVEESWGSIVNGVRQNKDGLLEAAFDYRAEGGAGGF